MNFWNLSLTLMAMIACLVSTTNAYGHHGRDFLITQSGHVPESGQIYVASTEDFEDNGDEKEWEFEPSLFVGITNGWAVAIHSHLERPQGGSLKYESTAIESIHRWTPRNSPIVLGSSFEYEHARDSDDSDEWLATGITGYQGQSWMTVLNVIAEHDTGESTEWNYALGIRRALNERFAVGVESQGTFESGQTGEAILTLYADPTPALTVNIGIGTGFNDGHDLVVRTALVYRIR